MHPQSRATESRQMEEICQLDDDDSRCQADNLKRKLAVQQYFLPKFLKRERGKNEKQKVEKKKGSMEKEIQISTADWQEL